MIIYKIDITNGQIRYVIDDVPRRQFVSVKKYFEVRGRRKPAPVRVSNQPFNCIYVTHGTKDNGLAIAIAINHDRV
jgi:hypothetical protein